MTARFVSLDDVRWCVTHGGIVDEREEPAMDDDLNWRCDMADDESACDVVSLWLRAVDAGVSPKAPQPEETP